MKAGATPPRARSKIAQAQSTNEPSSSLAAVTVSPPLGSDRGSAPEINITVVIAVDIAVGIAVVITATETIISAFAIFVVLVMGCWM